MPKRVIAAIVAFTVAAGSVGGLPVLAHETEAASVTMAVLASGLENPRGLKFGPDGALYVAEGGLGGSSSTVGTCPQVPFPVGPYTGGFTSRISRIDFSTGTRTTVVDGLPSSQTAAAAGSFVSGVSDVAFVGDTLYAVEAGAGCSHGLKDTANTIFRVNAGGSTTTIANLSSFIAAHPAANPDTADFEPDGTWYSMLRVGNALFTIEPNHQELDRVTRGGDVRRVVDFSTIFPGNTDWRGPTAMARHDGALFIGTLTPFPIVPGSAQVLKVDPASGRFSVFADKLTNILGLTFDEDGALYILESSAAAGFPTPGRGQVVRITGDERSTVVTGLSLPTAMTFGPDGNLYISNKGFGQPSNAAGEVVRVSFDGDKQAGDNH